MTELERLLKSASPDVQALNAHMLPKATGRATGRKSAERVDTRLEMLFGDAWRLLGLPELKRNVTFADGSGLELDFYHEASRVGVEINGGIWQDGKSGHSSGTGLVRDYEKLLLAHEHGIALVYVPPNWLAKSQITFLCERIWRLMSERIGR